MFQHSNHSDPFEWGPAKHRTQSQQEQQQQQQSLDQRDESGERPDDN